MNLDQLIRYHYRDRVPLLVWGIDYRVKQNVDQNGVPQEPEIVDWKPGQPPPSVAELMLKEVEAKAWDEEREANNQLQTMSIDTLVDALIRELRLPAHDFSDVQDIIDLREEIIAGKKPLPNDPRERKPKGKRPK